MTVRRFKYLAKYSFLLIKSILLYNWRFKNVGLKTIIRSPIINLENSHLISIGNQSRLMGGSRMECITSWQGKTYTPEVIIGNKVNIGHNFFLTCASKIEIGDGVLISDNVAVIDNEHEHQVNKSASSTPLISDKIIIEENVVIYRNSLILKGVKIGKNAIIGANSIIKKNVEANSIVAGLNQKIGEL